MQLIWGFVGSLDNDPPAVGLDLMNSMVDQHFKDPNVVPHIANISGAWWRLWPREFIWGSVSLHDLAFSTVWTQNPQREEAMINNH